MHEETTRTDPAARERGAPPRPRAGDGRACSRAWLRATILGLAALAATGCGPSPSNFPDEHFDVLIAATDEGGGDLAIDYDFTEPVPLFLSATVGGLDLYSAADPGFAPLEEDEPDEGFYVVEDGVDVSLEVTALDPGVRVKFGSVTLDEVGDSVVIGTTPELHTHGEWQVVVPEGTTAGAFSLSFRFVADSPDYGPSEPVTAVLALTAGEPTE